jgi:hypothetical protein
MSNSTGNLLVITLIRAMLISVASKTLINPTQKGKKSLKQEIQNKIKQTNN